MDEHRVGEGQMNMKSNLSVQQLALLGTNLSHRSRKLPTGESIICEGFVPTPPLNPDCHTGTNPQHGFGW